MAKQTFSDLKINLDNSTIFIKIFNGFIPLEIKQTKTYQVLN